MHEMDRGIIKWLPFDALSGFKEAIFKLKERKSNFEKPILSEDQIAELNYEISIAVELKKNITVYYYLNGRIYLIEGFVSNIDMINKRIKIENKWIKENNVLKIDIN